MKDYCQTNFLQPMGFKVTVSKKRFPYLSFMAQAVQHPAMETNATEVGYPRTNIPFIGDKIEFGTTNFDVILDENMEVYREVYDWMKNMVETKHELSSLDDNSLSDYCDIRIDILSSSNNKNKVIHYINAFPISLGDISLNAATDETYITCPMSFRFDYFEIL